MRQCFWVLVLLMMVVSFSAPEILAGEQPSARYLVRFKFQTPLPSSGTPAQIINHLRKDLKANVLSLKKVMKSAEMTPYWIANAVALDATPQEVKDLSALPSVEAVTLVRYRKWIEKDIDPKPVDWDRKQIQWSIQKVRAPDVWQKYKIDGTGVVVGHLDTGIDANHPALKGKILAFKDFTATPAAEPFDDQGHGTHTAGSIAGGDGVGVAPGAKLIVAKVFDRYGSAQDEWLLAAMQWVMDPDGIAETNDGPRLVSNSWGSDETSDRTFWTAVQSWVSAGIVPVFAAGNSGPWGKVGTPGNFPHSWAVAATSNTDSLAYFSSQGPTTWDGVTYTKPDIAAPGSNVISCAVGGGLVSNSGTSMACPHVAGLVALMFQANPTLTIEQIRTTAESTAIDLGTPGKDNKFGSGRFDALACLDKVMAQANLRASFDHYEALLLSEKALVGIGPQVPLSGPFARSVLIRSLDLDEGEFRTLSDDLSRTGEPASQALLKEAASLRTARNLEK